MSSASTPIRSPSLTSGRPDKMKKQKIAVLKLSSTLLSRFSTASKQESKSSSSSQPASTPKQEVEETAQTTSGNDNASESNATPIPSTDLQPSGDPPKKRKGPAPGYKRSLGQGVDGVPKQRGKPGPKKKPRLEDGTIDHSATPKPVAPALNGVAAHKLGPKANQGAINAGLRALDRTGKPVRKWARKPFQLKSFTGVVWEIPSWKGGSKPLLQEHDDSSETKDSSQQSSSDIKPADSSTNVESNSGDMPEPMIMSTPAASSPIPAPPSISAHG